MSLSNPLMRFKPAVGRTWLLLAAGLLWTAVGVLLCRFAYRWLAAAQRGRGAAFAALGVAAAVVIYRFGFSLIAMKNIDRVGLLSARPCLFAFQAWRSYLIVVFMMALGIMLRHSAIPKPYLAVVYCAIGGGLLLSSLHYYHAVFRVAISRRNGTPPPSRPAPG